MKKLLIVMVSAFVSACACFQSSDKAEPQVVAVEQEQTPKVIVNSEPQSNVRYVRRVYVNTENCNGDNRGRRIYYRDMSNNDRVKQNMQLRCHYSEDRGSACGEEYTIGNCSCPDKIRVTREPVEVIYRKVKYRTVYRPEIHREVSYEREFYSNSELNHE